MLKLNLEDLKLSELDPGMFKYVQWKALTLSDIEGVSTDILSKNLMKLSKPLFKKLLKDNIVPNPVLSNAEWIQILADAWYENNYEIVDSIQLPYSCIKQILDNQNLNSRWSRRIAKTQRNMEAKEAIKYLTTSDINELFLNSSNITVRDYLLNSETELKTIINNASERMNWNLKSTEANKIGFKCNNFVISVENLRKERACDPGVRACSRILKELGCTEISWDDAVELIRNDPKLQTRANLIEYMNWINYNVIRIRR